VSTSYPPPLPEAVQPLDLAPYLADSTVEMPAPVKPLAYTTPDAERLETPLRLLPPLGEVEPWWKRHLFLVFAVALVCGYFYYIHCYFIPAPGLPGIDENAYLVGGKNIVDHHSTGFAPPTDYAYVGLMWVKSEKNGWYYPKYGFGPSLLAAVALWTGGAKHGIEWAYLISPICTSLSVLAMFLLTRAITNSFFGLLSMIALGSSMTVLFYSIIPNSHAPSLCMVTWGMYMLIRWWLTGRAWRGIIAGLLLGYAVTIRYSEAMLLLPLYPLDMVLSDLAWWKAAKTGGHLHWLYLMIKTLCFLPIGPLGIAVLLSIRYRRLKSYLRASVPLIAWAIPVAVLTLFNHATLGHLSGYDLTRESKGFTSDEFVAKWPFAVQQLYLFGLFVFLPLGLAGMMMLFRQSSRYALLLLLWFLPGTLLYFAYYWGRGVPGPGYLRFFESFFPAAIAAGMWLLYSAGWGARRGWMRQVNRGSFATPISAGLLTMGCAMIGFWITQPMLIAQERANANLAWSADSILFRTHAAHPKAANPVTFCDTGMFPQLLQHMQFVGKGDWYSGDAFDQRFSGGFGIFGIMRGKNDPNDDDKAPVLLQTDRIDYMTKFYAGKTDQDLVKYMHQLVADALAKGRPVYAVLSPAEFHDWKKRLLTDGFTATTLEHWIEPDKLEPIPDNPLAPRDWFGMFGNTAGEFYLLDLHHAAK
jgi:hypothetical protein